MTTVLHGGIERKSVPGRVWRLIVRPGAEWRVIAEEQGNLRALYIRYVLPLAILGPLCGFAGGLVFGLPVGQRIFPPDPVSAGFATAAAILLNLATVHLTAMATEAMASMFGGQTDKQKSFRLVAYALTPVWLAGAVAFYPPASMLGIVGLYAIYVLYRGVQVMIPSRRKRPLLFTLAIAGAALVPLSLAGLVPATIARINLIPDPGQSARWHGRLQLPGMAGERKRIQAMIQRDAVNAATFASDRNRAPVTPDELRILLPEALPGSFTRTSAEATGGVVGAATAARAKALYAAPKSGLTLEILDMGPTGGVAAGLGPTGNAENAAGYAKVGLVDGRLTSERYDRTTYSGSYGVVVAGRFAVRADGRHVVMGDLQNAVRAVDFERLEALARG